MARPAYGLEGTLSGPLSRLFFCNPLILKSQPACPGCCANVPSKRHNSTAGNFCIPVFASFFQQSLSTYQVVVSLRHPNRLPARRSIGVRAGRLGHSLRGEETREDNASFHLSPPGGRAEKRAAVLQETAARCVAGAEGAAYLFTLASGISLRSPTPPYLVGWNLSPTYSCLKVTKSYSQQTPSASLITTLARM